MSAAVFAITLYAQNPRGSLRGTVQDATGARVASAKIVLQSLGTSTLREATSEDRGEFRLDDLLPGDYRIAVSAANFAPAQADVSIAVATVREVTVTLKPAAASATVTVQSQASSITTQPIDLVNVVHQGIIGTQDLENLPLAARSFANIAYLAPGTEPVEPSDPTKARITAVSTGGSSGLNNDLSVDGGDNSDDWIGGFLQNFSPETIQEFAVRTANEDADTGGTTAGSVVITTKRGTNAWHGSGSFYDRAAALNARFPIENPAPNPKQPFSRQNYIGTIGGPIAHDKVWLFSSFEYLHENASIAYSPNSLTEFNALAQIAADGLIPGVPSLTVPPNVPIPFRDYLGSLRFDWAQSSKSQWFLRMSEDSYLTHNALVAQGTLPSTGLITHNNYGNSVISNTYEFSPTWLGTFVFDASLLHLTQTRTSTLGFALAFPFSSTTLTVSGFETYGDNQFATPITLFPSLRNQEKYQLRYDLGHATGDHSLQIRSEFHPRAGAGWRVPGETGNALPVPQRSHLLHAEFHDAGAVSHRLRERSLHHPRQRRHLLAKRPAPRSLRGRFLAALAPSHRQLWLALPDDLRALHRFRPQPGRERDIPHTAGITDSVNPSAPHDYRKQFAPRLGLAYSPGNSGKTVLRAGFGLFYNDLAQNGWGTAFQAVNSSNFVTGGCSLTGTTGAYALTGPGCLKAEGSGGNIIDSDYKTPYAIHITGGVQHAFNEHWTLSADYTHEQGNHGYRALQLRQRRESFHSADSNVRSDV